MKFYLSHTRLNDKSEREIFEQLRNRIWNSRFREKMLPNRFFELNSFEELRELSKIIGFDLIVNVSDSDSWLLQIWDSYPDRDELRKRGIKI